MTVGGVSLSVTEQVRAPDLTNLLWVLQIELYSLLRALLLGGAGLDTQPCRLLVGLFVADETSSLLGESSLLSLLSLGSTLVPLFPSRTLSMWCWPNTKAGPLGEQTHLLYD